jgi:hypothetical protein
MMVTDHSETIHALPFVDGLVLLNVRRQRLYVYNAAARFVWDELRQGRTADGVASILHHEGNMALADASESVRMLVAHWREERLLGALDPDADASVLDVPHDWNDAPEPEWAARWHLLIRGVGIELAVEDASLVDVVRRLFGDLETTAAGADVRIEVRITDSGESALLVDGIEQCRMVHPGSIKDSVHHAVRRKLWPELEWLALIHGGAVATAGRAILFPADSGSGKTTLIAYLVRHGFDYLADDTIALTEPDGALAPWPVPLSIKEGSWPVLMPLYPELAEGPSFRAKDQQARLLPPPRGDWDVRPMPVQAIIFPRYRPDAGAQLRRLEPLEAIQRLAEARFWPGNPMSPEKVRRFLDWLTRTPAFFLEYESLPDAAALVSRAVFGVVSDAR